MLGATAPAQLRLSADFDTGNLGKIVRIDSMHLKHRPDDSVRMYSVEVLTRPDPKNPVDPDVPPSERWFHFRMEGVRGKHLFLRIPNTEVRRPFYSYDGTNYMRFTRRENLNRKRCIRFSNAIRSISIISPPIRTGIMPTTRSGGAACHTPQAKSSVTVHRDDPSAC